MNSRIDSTRTDRNPVYTKIRTPSTRGTRFLDDSLFFERYLKKKLFEASSVRSTTVPLKLLHSEENENFLLYTLMPWIGNVVGMSPDSLAGVRVSLEEVLHNVQDHSGVKVGCIFAQHFPNKSEIQIAISDFGAGIPAVVRRVSPELSDTEALRRACEEGFTTQSNVRNRGAGLPTLIRYVTMNNGGNVLIVAGQGNVSASPRAGEKNSFRITARVTESFYPGTLVRVILRTDTLEQSAMDSEYESFSW